jgi:PiT family inorganic phosphate transporter
MQLALVAGTLALGLYMAWNIGANDFANSMADAVGSRSVSIRFAVVLGAVCELAGSTLVGSHVADTVRKGIVDPALFASFPELLALGMLCALLGTALWLNIATWLGMPVSTTHGIVGAVSGLGVAAIGWSAVEWVRIAGIVASWLISPVLGGLLAFLLFKAITALILAQEKPLVRAVSYAPLVVFLVAAVVVFSTLYKSLGPLLRQVRFMPPDVLAVVAALVTAGLLAFLSRFFIARYLRGNEGKSLTEQLERIERVFAPLVVLTSSSVAFAHGANDVANAIGPVAAIFDVYRSGTVAASAHVPLWILAFGGLGIVLGMSTYGYRVMNTIGTRITQLTPSRGVAADLATVSTVLACSLLKLPVSTTHTIVGAIIGVGLARGLEAVNRKVTRDIFGSWLITVPASALMTAGLYLLARLLHLEVFIRQALPKVIP